MAILSIQSAVAYGHVGNSAATFPLQRLGREVWAVPTVQFSNHPGYGARTGQVFPAALVRDLVDGIAGLGVLSRCQGVLSGYLGDAATGQAVRHAVAAVRAANPAALFCCDPVIGDTGPGRYVAEAVPATIRDLLLPEADILTPNHWELEALSGTACATLAGAKHAAAGLLAAMRDGGTVLVTSLRVDDTPADAVDLLVMRRDGAFRLRTPLLPIAANGTGDTISALFLHHFLRTRDAAEALACAASSVWGLLRATAAAGSRELLIVAAQEEYVRPCRRFNAETC